MFGIAIGGGIFGVLVIGLLIVKKCKQKRNLEESEEGFNFRGQAYLEWFLLIKFFRVCIKLRNHLNSIKISVNSLNCGEKQIKKRREIFFLNGVINFKFLFEQIKKFGFMGITKSSSGITVG